VEVPRRLGAVCGIAAPTAFVAGWVVNGLRTDGYDPLAHAISQLAREGAPTRAAMTACFVAFGLLLPLWAGVVARELGVPALRWVVTLAGLATLAVAALPLTREGGQAQDTGHAVAALVGYVAMAVTPLVAARGLRGWRREASLLVGLASAFALATSVAVDAGGGYQRLGLTLVDAWHVVVASWVLLRARSRSGEQQAVRP
jgi:hypothetical membrane protein